MEEGGGVAARQRAGKAERLAEGVGEDAGGDETAFPANLTPV